MKVRICKKCGQHNSVENWDCSNPECRATMIFAPFADIEKDLVNSDTPFIRKDFPSSIPRIQPNSLLTTKQDISLELPKSKIACPVCGKDDMIQKVTVIYSAGTANSVYTGTTTAIASGSGKSSVVGGVSSTRGITQTSLAQRLAPPLEPHPESINCMWYAVPFIPYLDVVLMLVAPVSPAIKFFIALAVAVAIYGISEDAGVITAGGVIAAFIAYYWGLSQETKRRNNDLQYKKLLANWETAIKVWNDLYHCGRNDCVFNPKTGLSVDTDNIEQLLF